MPDKPVITNNTPLVALWILGRLDLLRDLYWSYNDDTFSLSIPERSSRAD